jgi:hypothetical protein
MSDMQRFDTLCDMQLITPALRDQVRQDPRRAESSAYPGLSHALLWLVVRKLLSEDELEATESRLRSSFSGEAYRERQTVLDEVKANLRTVKQKRNRKALQTLQAEGLLSQAQFNDVARHLPDDDRCATPSATLAWAILNRHVPLNDFEALVQRPSGLGTAARQILDDTQRALDGTFKAGNAEIWRQAFPGPRWAWIAGAVLFVAGWVWWSGPSSRTPPCDAKEVRAAVSGMLLKASMGRRMPGAESPGLALTTPQDIQSVGYDEATKVRGCTCTIDLFGMAMPFGYTIEPLANAGEFNVVKALPSELAQRFPSKKDE